MNSSLFLGIIVLVALAACNGNSNPVNASTGEDWIKCSNVSLGWKCSFDYISLYEHLKGGSMQDSEAAAEAGQRVNAIREQYSKKCKEEGGNWYCAGSCLPNYNHYCYLPLPDAGEDCNSSSECTGKCQLGSDYESGIAIIHQSLPDYQMNGNVSCKNCSGQCTKYLLNPCERWFEFDNGIIVPPSGVLCD